MFDSIPIEIKLLIFSHFDKKELKKLTSVCKDFKSLASNERLEINKIHKLLISKINKKILELSSIQKKHKNVDRFSFYHAYKINIHTDFSILKANVITFLEIMDLYGKIFDTKFPKDFFEKLRELNAFVIASSEIAKEEKDRLMFYTYEKLEQIAKHFKKSKNPILQNIAKLTNLIVHVEPSFYKREPINEKPAPPLMMYAN